MVMGEGAGAMILESERHAAARGAQHAYARVAGTAFVVGSSHPTRPDVDLIALGMGRALARAGVGPDGIDAVNAHGTSTRLNDLEESRAIRMIFGSRTGDLAIAACKSILGHASVAAGIVESIAAVLSMGRGVATPIPTCREPDPACGLPVLSRAEPRPIRGVVKNAFGFGGQYGSAVFVRA
jgi:3-oxoacyl-[acyl-carrier-protein] synthase II